MQEWKMIFDVLADNEPDLVIDTIMAFIEYGIPCLMIFIAIRSFRKSKSWSSKTIIITIGIIGVASLVMATMSLFRDPLKERYSHQIEMKDYIETTGFITNLTVTTHVAGQPAANFEVAGRVFKYGSGSENYAIAAQEKGGILANGLMIKICYKDEKILRMFSSVDQ